MNKSFFYVNQAVAPSPELITQAFRIVERYHTCDGFRDRLTDRCFDTLEEAVAELARLESSQ